jgi:hypothetical protein
MDRQYDPVWPYILTIVQALLLGACVVANAGYRERIRLVEADRDTLLEIAADRELVAGRLDRIEAALTGAGERNETGCLASVGASLASASCPVRSASEK